MKRWQAAIALAALTGAGVVWKREPLAMAWMATKVEKSDIAARSALLKDFIEIIAPEGEGPFPVVMQLHGCAGVRPSFHHQWAEIAVRAGYAVVIVDSNNPRGYRRDDGLNIVCRGKALLGQERAGDIPAAVNALRDDPRLDFSRLVLAGWSHGAWTALDFLTMSDTANTPPGLDVSGAEWPRVDAAILIYPYCGFGALTRFRALAQHPKMLALIAGEDEVVDADKCISYFERLKTSGGDVDMTVYPHANHVFDDPGLEPQYQYMYDKPSHDAAAARYEAFLRGLSD